MSALDWADHEEVVAEMEGRIGLLRQRLQAAQEAWLGLAGHMVGHEIPCATIVKGGKCDCGFDLYQILFRVDLMPEALK